MKFRFVMLFCVQIFVFSGSLEAKNPDLVLQQKEINRFLNIIKLIKKNYVADLNDEKIINDAVKGVLNSLDQYSVYYNKNDYLEILEKNNGEYKGIGAEIIRTDGSIKVFDIKENSPAFLGGLRVGDEILEANNIAVSKDSFEIFKKIMKSYQDGDLDLKIRRTSIDGRSYEILNFKIFSEIIKIDSINSKKLDEKSLYIKVNQFSDSTFNEIKEVIDQFPDLFGLIIDLRDNGGGLLEQAIKISDGFLSAGDILSVEYKKNGDGSKKYKASGDPIVKKDVKVVVLINNKSASASEIIASALQDNKRAVLVGQKSFGKGSIQNIIQLDNGDAMKVTTALFYRPSGDPIQEIGVKPDIEVENKLYETNPDSDLQFYIARQVLNSNLISAKQ
jgi:carboxyl-terminal processing protease